jgi:AcrR family transcriptional regulator
MAVTGELRSATSPRNRSATRRSENAEATRAALLKAALKLISARGYADVSIDEICRRARVTKGALYHHFRDKRDLFRALCEYVEEAWVDEMVAAVSAERDALRRLELGCDAFLDGCLDPARQRILLLDGPAVLDWEELRRIDSRRGLGLIGGALEQAMEAGRVESQPVEPLAHLIYGALSEASLAIARDDKPEAARRRMGVAMRRLIEGLRPADSE